MLGATTDAFELVGDGSVGAVLVHGFTGTPHEVRYLGEQLAAAGIAVCAPRLPGHGTTLEDLDRTTWRDWTGAVDHAIDALVARRLRVAVVGQSLGGLLALHAASRRPELACVASLAAPLWLDAMSARVARWTRPDGPLRRIRTLPKLGGPDVRDPRAKAANRSYPRIPTLALSQLTAFMPVVDQLLPTIKTPVLVLHGLHDHTAPVACASQIAVRARAARLRILPRSFHLISDDVERDLVAAEVTAFIRHHADAHEPGHVGPATGDPPCAT